jgi:lipopolysaccharide/colanic/teichoic acid biosynthesis glycosyltransferase
MKRALDIIFASTGLLLLFPLLVVISVFIRCEMGAPIFFQQMRPGLGGKQFKMVKFRTMDRAVDYNGLPLSDGERITRLGRFLRATSLDEIPELWNVLKGDMSLVGPRPLLPEYLALYSPLQKRRHEVRPGITGWAQVNGRNAISWEEKFELDVWYVDNSNLLVDFRIIWLTFFTLARRNGISAAKEATMPKFTGNEDSSK